MDNKEYPPVPKGYIGIFRVRPDRLTISNVFHEAWGITGRDVVDIIDWSEGKGEFTGDPDHEIRAAFYRTYEDLKNGVNMIYGKPYKGVESYFYPVSKKKNNYW